MPADLRLRTLSMPSATSAWSSVAVDVELRALAACSGRRLGTTRAPALPSPPASPLPVRDLVRCGLVATGSRVAAQRVNVGHHRVGSPLP